jgi:hypothetical protein
MWQSEILVRVRRRFLEFAIYAAGSLAYCLRLQPLRYLGAKAHRKTPWLCGPKCLLHPLANGGGTAPGTCKTSGMHVNVRRLIYL